MVAEIVVVKGSHRGEFVQIHQSPVTVGRAKTAQLCLENDGKVSSAHAKIVPLGGERYVLEDLGSTNGTFVNEERIEQVPLRSGDLIKIGRSLMIFRSDGSSVHLSDVKLEGGGSSVHLRPPPQGAVAEAGLASPPPQGGEGDELARLATGLEECLLAGSEAELGLALRRVLMALLELVPAGRAMVFLFHPTTGGMGCAAREVKGGFPEETPIDADLLGKAAAGQILNAGGSAAGPVSVAGRVCGVVTLNGPLDGVPSGLVIRLLTAAGIQAGILVGADRSRRLAGSAIEIVGLAQAQVQRRPVDLSHLLQGTDRLFAGAAARRRLTWQAQAPAGLTALVDPLLLGRGLDTLVEHALAVSRDAVSLTAAPGEGGTVRLRLTRGLIESPEAALRQLDPEGVAADLRRASAALDDGALAVARVALLRAGVRFTVGVEESRVVYTLEMESAGSRGDA